MSISEESLCRFISLFRGNTRSFGQWLPNEKDPNKSSFTKKGLCTGSEVLAHLNGKVGLGLVPILDDSTCVWGAIDIDNHGQSEDLDIRAIERRVRELKLPLVTCRSKSGGVHLFLFCKEPLQAGHVNAILKKWAKDLKVLGVDCIFPKQSKLAYSDDGGRALGNWINFPYFNANSSNRYAIEKGEPLPLELFLTLAESKRIGLHDLSIMQSDDHSEAPPCIQAIINGGIEGGSRNEAAYSLTVYMKKKSPEDFRDRMYDLNGQVFSTPLPFIEIKKVVTSASRRDYRYKCGTEPCKSLCDRQVCLTRKFGITQDVADEMDAEYKLPLLNGLTKYLTDPVQWELSIEGQSIRLTTEALFDWRIIRLRAAEKLTRVVPAMKVDRWTKALEVLMAECRIVDDVPEDASADGIIKAQLIEFVRKCDLGSDGKDMSKRKDLFRGVPVVQLVDGTKYVYFRAGDFTTFLKRNRTDELRGVSLWFSLKKLGVGHGRLRVEEKSPTVWFIAIDDEFKLKLTAPNFASEF